MAGLFDIFTNKNAQDAANAQKAGYQQAYGQYSDLANQGRTALTSNVTAGLQPNQQNFSQAQGGVNQLMALLGIGPNGSAGIQDTLQNLPGYQFALDQGNQNVLRNQAATGQLNSGGTNLDLQKFGQGLANQNYNQYLQQLMPFLGASQSAAGNIGNLYSGLGTGLNQSFGNQGQAAFGSQVGQGNAQANADLANNTASQNMWNVLGGAAKLAMGGLGGGIPMGGGGLFGSFGGGPTTATGPVGTGGWQNPDYRTG